MRAVKYRPPTPFKPRREIPRADDAADSGHRVNVGHRDLCPSSTRLTGSTVLERYHVINTIRPHNSNRYDRRRSDAHRRDGTRLPSMKRALRVKTTIANASLDRLISGRAE